MEFKTFPKKKPSKATIARPADEEKIGKEEYLFTERELPVFERSNPIDRVESLVRMHNEFASDILNQNETTTFETEEIERRIYEFSCREDNTEFLLGIHNSLMFSTLIQRNTIVLPTKNNTKTIETRRWGDYDDDDEPNETLKTDDRYDEDLINESLEMDDCDDDDLNVSLEKLKI